MKTFDAIQAIPTNPGPTHCVTVLQHAFLLGCVMPRGRSRFGRRTSGAEVGLQLGLQCWLAVGLQLG